jgi:hypothetical protein
MNLVELHDSTKRLAHWRGEGYGMNRNWIVKNVVPYVGTKSLLFTAECYGESVDATHICHMMFTGVRYLEEDVENAEYKTIEYHGVEERYVYPDLKTNIVLSCTCPDYRYRWEYANKKAGALFGRLSKKYIRKTKTRKPVNPDLIPGICRHLFQMQSYLRVEGYIK